MELTKDKYKIYLQLTKGRKQALHELKNVLIPTSILMVTDSGKSMTLITDASNIGLGGEFLQDDGPHAFESKEDLRR